MNKHTTAVAAFAAACLAGSTAYAGTHIEKPSKKIVEPAQESCITGDIGFDVVSEYITKGLVQQNQGFIIQPYADLHFRVYKGAGALSSITVDLGIWNSFHSHWSDTAGAVNGTNIVQNLTRLGAAGGLNAANAQRIGGNLQRGTTPGWYEFDFQAGLTLNFGKLAVSPYFKVYESPSDSFRDAYAVGLQLAYDDKDLLGNFALHPYVFAELNLQGTTGNGNRGLAFNGSPANGQYYEVGIAPGHSFGDLTLTLPIKAGFGSGDEYALGRGFGYFSVGADAAYALSFVPKCLGAWTVHAGASYNRLGTGAAYSAAPFGRFDAAGNLLPGDKNQFVFQGGLKVAF